MSRSITILFAVLFPLCGFAAESVVINEVMPCNISTYMDKSSSYNFPGFVEFYNSDTLDVDLKGYEIIHEKKKSSGEYELKWSWVIDHSLVVKGEDYILIFFDKRTEKAHAPYKLDSDGGTLVLKNGAGTVVSSLTYGAMGPHLSYGSGGYMEPTPLKANSEGFASLSRNRVKKPVFGGEQPGIKTGEISVTLSSNDADIYYTTDGSEPSKSSTLYTKAIKLSENTVIRAKAYADGMLSSEILTGSFFFGDSDHDECGGYTLPIVSIATNEEYFEGAEVGISTTGTNGLETTKSCLPAGKANYMQDWDRPVNFEYIVDGQQVISHEAEAAVMGGCSRQYTVKSMKYKAGKKLGSGNETFNYKFFPEKSCDKYKAVQVRNGGNAYQAEWIRCRDGFMASIAKAMDIDYQAYEPVAYYINGEYQGLMGLRERTNSVFVESNHNVDEDNIDLIELTNDEKAQASSGDTLVYHEMIEYAKNGDPKSEEYYKKMCSYIDMDEYIDYVIFEHFIVNTDWPGNNSKLWREKENGRFRWILFDTDFGLGLYGSGGENYCDYTMNSIEWSSGSGEKINWANDDGWEVALFSNLIKNETFKKKFLNRNLLQLGSVLDYNRISAVWDSLSERVDNEFCATFGKYTTLQEMSGVEKMLSFAQNRPEYMYKYLKDYYGIEDWVDLSFSSNVDGARFVMNGDLMPGSSFKGKYISGEEFVLEAFPPVGYKFSHWNLGDGTTSLSMLDKNSEWRISYDSIGFEDLSWTAIDFDDSKWLPGSGRMGYNSNDSSAGFNTVLDYGEDAGNKPLTAYFRSKFNISTLSGLEYLNFKVSFDDGIVIYINGKEVKRHNIEGEPTYSTPSSGYNPEDLEFKLEDFAGVLKEGENVIAIEVHQHEAKSSDLKLEISLTANYEGVVESNSSSRLVAKYTSSKDIIAVFEKVNVDELVLPLYISEVAPSNNSETEVADEYGNHPDWFEVYNAGEDTINLAGMYFSDDNDLMKCQVPYGYEETKLAPNSYMVFWADNKPFRGPNHVGFKMSNSDNSVVLLSYNEATIVSQVNYSGMPQNASMGRVDGVSEDYLYYYWECDEENNEGETYLLPTPGAANGTIENVCSTSGTPDPGQGGEATDMESYDGLTVVHVYPNPVNDVLEVSIPDVNGFSVSVYDQLGKVLIEDKTSDDHISLQMEGYPAGVYTLQVISNKIVSRRLIIKK